MAEAVVAISRWDLARVFGRSLWLQASWSFRDMQSMGLAWSLEPVLRRCYRGEALRQATLRYLQLFNSNPVLSAAILGAILHLEVRGGEQVGAATERLRSALMGPYGALGDSSFWGAAKPAVVLVAVLAACSGVVWAPWLLVGGFVMLNLGARLWGFTLGLRHGLQVAAAVNRLQLLHWAERIKLVCAALCGGVVVGVLPADRLVAWGLPYPAALAAAWVLVLLAAALVRRGVGMGILLGITVLLAAGSVWLT